MYSTITHRYKILQHIISYMNECNTPMVVSYLTRGIRYTVLSAQIVFSKHTCDILL